MKKILLIFILIFWLFSCFWWEKDKDIKTLVEYKQIWKDTFLNYQNTSWEIKTSWIFDTEFTIMLDGDEETLLNKFSTLDLKEPFNSLSFKVDGDYDFSDKNNIKLYANIKIYLNKRNFWLWSLDISVHLKDNKTLVYTINNLESKILHLFLEDKDTIDYLLLFYNDHKWQENTYIIPSYFMEWILDINSNNSLEENLYKNSKEEEEKIIQAFLENEVIEVLSGETKNNSDILYFQLNSDNLIHFLNEVAWILWDENENKNFENDKEIFKNITMEGNLEINKNVIINSYIKTQIILTWWEDGKEKKEDILTFETQLKLPDLKNFNLDMTTLISSLSSPNNKLQMRIKWLIK